MKEVIFISQKWLLIMFNCKYMLITFSNKLFVDTISIFLIITTTAFCFNLYLYFNIYKIKLYTFNWQDEDKILILIKDYENIVQLKSYK